MRDMLISVIPFFCNFHFQRAKIKLYFKFDKKRSEILYLIDLVSTKFLSFPRFKETLEEHRFQTIDEIKQETVLSNSFQQSDYKKYLKIERNIGITIQYSERILIDKISIDK